MHVQKLSLFRTSSTRTKKRSQRSKISSLACSIGPLIKVARYRFSLKFQQIVQREQEANFISRLHRGRINIVPWPVIESKQFYTLFSSVKKYLDKEPVTHPHAGIFLHTLKTLMAKLKVNASVMLREVL
jgi:hypothetical protein